MILDAHTHIGKKTIVASAEDLIRSMDKADIDKALVFAGKINAQATVKLLDDIAAFKGRLYAIGSVSPLALEPTLSNPLEAYASRRDNFLNFFEKCFKENKIHGLKFYPGYEYFFPQDDVVRPFLELLVKYDRPAIFHSGDCYNGVSGAKLKYAHPLHIDELAVELPTLKIVIAHMGYPWVRDAAEVCYKNKNVYADTSGFVYGKFTHQNHLHFFDMMYEFQKIAGGTEKIIFGTDWPISHQRDYVRQVKEWCYCADVPKKERKEILGLRAAQLFGIKDEAGIP